MTSTVEYLGGLRTSAIHLRSQNSILTDAPIDNQGKGETFSPTDLVATALASCIMTIMGITAEKNGLDISGAKASVTKTMASNPRRIAQIDVIIQMPSKNYTEKDRKSLEAAAHACPVGRSLHPETKEVLTILWE